MRDHFRQPIRDGNGVLLAGCSVRLLEPGTTTEITDTIYVDREGLAVRTNPWVADTGIIDFYLARSKLVRIGVVKPGASEEVFFEDIEVGNVDLARETLTFTIAGAIAVQTGILRLYIEADGEIEKVRVSVGEAPVGSSLVVDVNRNGISIFGADPKPTVLAGENTGVVTLTTPVQVAADTDYLTVDVDTVGASVSGSNLVVQVRMARY